MLDHRQAMELKTLIHKEAPELETEIVEDEVDRNTYHLKVTTRYVVAIRSEDEWHDRKRLLTEE